MTTVGIDKACFYSSHYFLDLKTLAEARGVDVEKFYTGLGQRKMAVSPPDEGVVTLAANAAHELLKDVDLSTIDTLMFATESGVDHSKATGIFVHKLLDLPPHCRVVELKQACYSATFGLQMAMSRLRENPKHKVLLIAADIARYGLGTSGESSQGGGACAMLLTANPRLLSIDPIAGFYTEDVMDFWRPHYREEALVDGKYSIEVYLKALAKAWEHYQTQVIEAKQPDSQYQDFQQFLFHIPIPKLAEKAYQKLTKLNKSPVNTTDAQAFLEPSLQYAREIGNCYTASLYIGLVSLLENHPDNLANQRVGLYSYGSGCMAEFFSGTIQPHYQQVLHTQFHRNLLDNRQELTQAEYEKFYTFEYPTDGSHVELPEYQTGQFRLSHLTDHKRVYQKARLGATAKAPGKLILSGEHSVVLGAPALATSIDLYTTTVISKHSLPGLVFDLVNIKHQNTHSAEALKLLKDKIKNKYTRFQQGEISIKQVLKKPFELAAYTASNAIDKFTQKEPKPNLHIHTDSQIPTGCGLGSSAAVIVSTNLALAEMLGKTPTEDELKALNIDAENLQHGQSSGLDVFLSMTGGTYYVQGETKTRLPHWGRKITLINTGTPTSATGECVAHTKAIFNQKPALLNQFAEITEQMHQAWQAQDLKLLKQAIKTNHQLLIQIGVVPDKIQALIEQIESHGGAAKICGAGAISGHAAGMVWVEGAEDFVKTLPHEILTVTPTEDGAKIV